METIKEVLMRRDHKTEEEADELIAQARVDLRERLITDGEDPFYICQDWFGLETDYIMDLL